MTGKAVVNGNDIADTFSLEQYRGKYVFFFYPADFTFVCPTELIAFQEKIEEFTSRNAVLVGEPPPIWNFHTGNGFKPRRMQVEFRV